MKAFKPALILFLLSIFLFSHTAVFAQTPSQTFNEKAFTPPTTTQAPTTTSPVTTTPAPGTVQLIPLGNGQYQLAPSNPNTNQYQIQKALCFNPSCVWGGIENLTSKIADWGKDQIQSIIEAAIKGGVTIVESVFVEQTSGCDPSQDAAKLQKCVSDTYPVALNTNTSRAHNGALLQLAQVNSSLLSLAIPVSTSDYFAHLNPFPQTQASGFSDLQQSPGIYSVWKNVRDAAYALSIVILVVVGFLIMFRTKIDPRTSVSISNMLPKIVIMLLLITFSYALGGLIIDAARLINALVINMINVSTLNIFSALLHLIMPTVLLGIGGAFIPGVGAAIFIVSMIVTIVILIYLLVVFLVIGYHIVVRYAQFIIGLVFGPLIMLAYPLPQGSDYLMLWLKKELAYIMTIPITFIILALAIKVGSDCVPIPTETGIMGCGGGIGGAISGEFIRTFLSPYIMLGILAVATKAPQIADDLLGNKSMGGPRGGLSVFGMLGAPSGALRSIGNMSKGLESVQKYGGSYGRYFGGGAENPSSTPGGGSGGLFAKAGRAVRGRGGVGGGPGLDMSNDEKASMLAYGHTTPLSSIHPDLQDEVVNARAKDHLNGPGGDILTAVNKNAAIINGKNTAGEPNLSKEAQRRGRSITHSHSSELSHEQQQTEATAYRLAAEPEGLEVKYSYDKAKKLANIQLYKNVPLDASGARPDVPPTANEQAGDSGPKVDINS